MTTKTNVAFELALTVFAWASAEDGSEKGAAAWDKLRGMIADLEPQERRVIASRYAMLVEMLRR
ncbi:MAG TPA: hypothetical protein VMA53_29150 [Stellaceae bacterium]|nr:hypothetical protein [Stellaceae bacterium]